MRIKTKLERMAEHNKRVLAELRREAGLPATRDDPIPYRPQTPQEAYERTLNHWCEAKLEDEQHERDERMRLDPWGLGLYDVEPFHRG